MDKRYELHELLGKGGMGAVYRATDRLTGETVALKQVTLEQLGFADVDTNEVRLSLAQEFQTLARLRHPNIISVLDFGFDEQKQPFFTMTFLDEGQNIRDAAQELAIRERVKLLIAMLQALAYLHRQGVLHRDLKPGNVFVVNKIVKILDFGLATGQRELEYITGTLAYIAPETIQSRLVSEASDLFSVGVIAYEILTGQHPFHRETINAMLKAILAQSPDFAKLPYIEAKTDDATLIISKLSEEDTVIVDTSEPLPAIQPRRAMQGSTPLALIVEQLLAKEPTARFHSAEAVIEAFSEAIDEPVPAETIAIRESYLQAASFVGRETELDQLTTALDASSGSTWLVGGESGVGKSRLLDELRIQALVKGHLVLRGQSVEGGGLPYQSWRDILPRLVLSTDVSDLEAGILQTIVPDIERLLGRPVAPVPELEGTAQRQRLAVTINDLFRRLKQPTLVILEDLQWAVESLELFKELHRIVAELPLMLIGSYRDDEAPDLPDALPDANLLILDRLPSDKIAELSYTMLGEVGRQAAVLDLLIRETEGNAFFLVEVVRSLAEEAGRLRNIGQMELPTHVISGGIQQIMQRRVARIPEWGQEMLCIAAMAGRTLDVKVLTHIAPQIMPDHDLEAWLQACNDATIIEIIDQRWHFNHDKLRIWIIENAPNHAQIYRHRYIAEALEAVYPNDEALATMLYDHWRMAENHEKAIHYGHLAATQMTATGDYQGARAILEHTLTYPLAETQRMILLKLLGDTQENLAHYAEAEAAYRESIAIAEKIEDKSAFVGATYGLGIMFTSMGELEQSIEHHSASLKLSQQMDNQKFIALNLGSLGTIAFLQGDLTLAEDYLHQALDISHDLNTLAFLNKQLGTVITLQGNPKGGEVYYQKSLQLMRQTGNKHGEAAILNNLGLVYSRLHIPQTALDYFQQSIASMRDIGDQRNVGNILNNMGQLAYRQGDYALAIDYGEQSLAVYRSIKTKHGIANVQCNLLFTYIAIGAIAEAQQSLLESLEISLEMGARTIVLELIVGYAWLKMLENDDKLARQIVASIEADPDTDDFITRERIIPLRGELEARLGDVETIPADLDGIGDADSIVERILQEYSAH